MKFFFLCCFVSLLGFLYRAIATEQRVDGVPIGASVVRRQEVETMNATTSELEILLDFKRGVLKDRTLALSSWNSNDSSPCAWEGVSCDDDQRVTALLLANRALEGTLSPLLGGLLFLENLNLSLNFFQGEIPAEFGAMRSITLLDLMENSLSGTIPASLGNLTRMERFEMRRNQLTGEIPSSLGGYSEIVDFNVGGNNLSGNIPTEFGKMQKLRYLYLWGNSLSGAIPSSLGNLSQLQYLTVSNNQLTGGIPPTFSLLKSITHLLLDHNPLAGTIPAFLGNLSALQHIYLKRSQLSGVIPQELGSLPDLTWLHVGGNIRLSGIIPPSLGKCRNLTFLDLFENDLNGSIPSSLGNLKKLQRIDFGSNRISGSIPLEISNCTSLATLTLSNNLISGTIPDELGRIGVSLGALQLNGNLLNGSVPLGLSNATDLQTIDLSHNFLVGKIPGELMAHLDNAGVFLNLSHNNLSGKIPPEIGGLESIMEMDFSSNNLVGEIPASIGGCKGLIRLDLSWNSLEGEIPETIGSLSSLSDFNVSFNQLTGSIPENCNLSNFTKDSYLGNVGLCGYVVENVCPSSKTPTSSCKGLGCKKSLIVGLTASIAVALLTFWIFVWCSYRVHLRLKGESRYRIVTLFDTQYKSNLEDICQSIDNLRNARCVGMGGNSKVYSVDLSGSLTIAIKVLKVEADNNQRQLKSMIRELKILGQLRHRNLLRLLGMSLNENFKAILLEYMPNGDLNRWLHGSEFHPSLAWKTRLNIAVGVASAITHLHHDHDPEHPIIHRDLKPSNILLDADFVPKVSDFGLAKIVYDTSDLDGPPTNSTTMSYTPGYAPPEYGVSFRGSTKGDVYAFGVILMELLTGTKPTDERFYETNIVKWVSDAFPTRLKDIVDHRLQDELQESLKQMHDVALLAILCTDERPQLRPTMQDVLPVLVDVENDSLGTPKSKSSNRWDQIVDLCNDSSSYMDRVTGSPTPIDRLPNSSG